MSLHVRIKICGITRLEDALATADLGVDAVGFVFYKTSPRYISPDRAVEIINRLPPFVSAVGLFVNPAQKEIDQTLADCPIDVIQLHGNESPVFCSRQNRRVIKAILVSGVTDLKRADQYDCSVLLDSRAPEGMYGGSGMKFDWSILDRFVHPYPVILAGGLNDENIRAALNSRQLHAVDVSSGVESSPGIKDREKMRRFVERVQDFNAQQENS